MLSNPGLGIIMRRTGTGRAAARAVRAVCSSLGRFSNGDRVSMKFRQGLMSRSALAVLLVAGALAAPTAASAETIVVEGNHRVDSETIRSYFSGGDSNEAIKKLYSTGYFSDVQVSRQGGALVVRVVENSTSINHVVFVGNSKVKSEDLQKEIQEHDRGAYSKTLMDSDVLRIQDVYRRSGRNNATVSAHTVETPNGAVDV